MDTMESVALDKNAQGKFQKSIKGIKKLIASGKLKKPEENKSEETPDIKQGKKKRKYGKDKGLVYISSIPHGFYEKEMTKYFSQFGVVTNVRVIRSKKTGKSKGCAFVEFADTGVAKVVADTTNNYLMGKRLLKAAYIPPEKQRREARRKNWNERTCPGAIGRRKTLMGHNTNFTDEEHVKKAKRLLKQLFEVKRRLKESGVNYDFFEAQDIPTELTEYANDLAKKSKAIPVSDPSIARPMRKPGMQLLKNKVQIEDNDEEKENESQEDESDVEGEESSEEEVEGEESEVEGEDSDVEGEDSDDEGEESDVEGEDSDEEGGESDVAEEESDVEGKESEVEEEESDEESEEEELEPVKPAKTAKLQIPSKSPNSIVLQKTNIVQKQAKVQVPAKVQQQTKVRPGTVQKPNNKQNRKRKH